MILKSNKNFIEGLSYRSKERWTAFGTLIFPLVHAASNFEDFKKFWTNVQQETGEIKEASTVEIGALAFLSTFGTVGWVTLFSTFGNFVDSYVAQDRHKDKINTAIEELSCEVPEGLSVVDCGSKVVEPTSYSAPWIPFSSGETSANTVRVIVTQFTVAANGEGEGGTQRNVCAFVSSPDMSEVGTCFMDEPQ